MRWRGSERALAAVTFAASIAAGCSAVSGLGGLHFDGSGSGGSGGSGGATGSGGGQCDHEADCNPRACISVACVHHACVVAASDAETACAGGVCDGHGSCVACVNASDCGAAPDCHSFSCVSRACNDMFAAAGTPCGDANAGLICDLVGHCVACNDAAVCGANRDCKNHACIDLCSDGVSDYGETGVDCGGPCAPCPTGQPCQIAADCASGHCADGVCCISDCSGVCQACNVVGSVGYCNGLPADKVDPGFCDATHGACGGACACASFGKCLLADGEPCTQSSQCASHHCGGSGICKP